MKADFLYKLSYSTFEEEEKEAIFNVVESDLFTMGERVKEFESNFAKFFGKKYAIMVNSGSSANLIGIASLFYQKASLLKRGDEAIVPSISWATTYYPLQQYGLKLKFVDIDLYTLNYDLEKLENAISSKTRMIITVSVLGNPNYFDDIARLCKEKNIILFDDNCESMGAKYKDRYTGTYGLINTFSTFFSHHISTMEGGVILTDNYEIYCLCKSLRNHGWTRDQEVDSPIVSKRKDDFFENYRFILPGYNVRPTEIQGALGIVQLKKLSKFLKIRRENAKIFKELFRSDDRFIIQKEVGESSYFAFTMVLDPKLKLYREKILNRLRKSGIEFRIITGGCFLEHEVIKYFDYEEHDKIKNARYAHHNGWFVGNAPIDLSQELEYLYKILKEI